MRRLPLKSSLCLMGAPVPSPEQSATAPVPHQRANLGSRSNRRGSPTSHSRVAAEMVPMPGSPRRVVPWRSSSSSMRRSRRRICRRAARSWSMSAWSQPRRYAPEAVTAQSGSTRARRRSRPSVLPSALSWSRTSVGSLEIWSAAWCSVSVLAACQALRCSSTAEPDRPPPPTTPRSCQSSSRKFCGREATSSKRATAPTTKHDPTSRAIARPARNPAASPYHPASA